MRSPFTPLLLLLGAVAFAAQDAARDLRAKDPAVREAAVRKLSEAGGDKVEKQLLDALGDDDWLVQLAALDGLAEHGTKAAQKALKKVALEAPYRRARIAAGTALGRTMPIEASLDLYDDLRGKHVARALPALTAALVAGGTLEERARIEKLLEDEEIGLRADAARAWIAGAPAGERRASLARLFADGDLVQRAAGLEQLASSATGADLEAFADVLAIAELPPVLERRAEAGAAAALLAIEGEDARAERFEKALLAPLAERAEALPRLARIAGAAAKGLPSAKAQGWLERISGSPSEDARAAAAKALISVGGDMARDFALTGMAGDTSARVRRQYLATAAALGAVAVEAGEAAIAKRATDDGDARVRERAAIALGRESASAAAVAALVTATRDGEWEVAVSATVALGRTRSDAAVAELAALAKHADWKIRGAAGAGLFHAARSEAIDPLIALLGDEASAVAATAHHALLAHSGRSGEEVDPKEWKAWWKENLARVRFVTPDEARERRERYGYSVPDRQIYLGLDVVVVPGRGDSMESVLGRLDIAHRTVQGGQLGDGGLHPFAILVAGCTGEIEQRDVEVIRWYVRSGGALFTSCWALTYTVEKSFPGLVTKFPSPGEVLDRVSATPVAPDSPYLTGVFDGGVVPIYELQGAHLIEVLDPERVEVLVDSPETAMRHGSGDLTAWFRAGHGVVLDSVNHFDLQGLELATDLKEPEELQGYAVDHMGLTLERLRELADEKWWKSRSKAAKEVNDLSAFRILTNFVREKRVNGG